MRGTPGPAGSGPLGPEFELIEKLAAHLPAGAALPADARTALRIGIGDDAAVWELSSGELGILTVDTVVEGIHAFPHEPPEAVGARALTAAISDVAAMGGSPMLALVALQAPRAADEGHLLRIYDGIGEEADLMGVAVVGGDVVDTPGPLALAVVVFGIAAAGTVWTRSGAHPGDVVAVTGSLGGSRAGVELLGTEGAAPDEEWAVRLVERHLRPHARVSAARTLSGFGDIHAAIDISDGLSSESWHLALSSGVEVHLQAESIPLNPDLEEHMAWRARRSESARETDGVGAGGPGGGQAGLDAVYFAIDSGEEYELLVTLAPEHPALADAGLGGEGQLTVIGRIEKGEPAVVLHGDGWSRSLLPGGYSHRQSEV